MVPGNWHNLKYDLVPQRTGACSHVARGVSGMPRWDVEMAGQLHTVAEAAAILKVRESWLKTKAAAR